MEGPPGPAYPARRIHILPEAVRSRIAAGEVIERPASVVKELVENALDAGARRIHVQLEGGGRELIRVSDDGAGMDESDLALSVKRHATSKLTEADDLYALLTLGFRGEALPAIGSVSRLTIVTRPRGADQAWRLEVEGGGAPRIAPAAGSYGTVVEVRGLFYNLPVRRKFLKGPGPEAAACSDMLLRLALVRPDAAFTLAQGRQEFLSCPVAAPEGLGGPGDPGTLKAYLQRAREALGRAATADLAPVCVAAAGQAAAEAPPASGANPWPARGPAAGAPYRLYGLLCRPDRSRPNRSQIFLAVNGRPVRDRTLSAALVEAYRQWLPPRRFPAAVVFLELPGSDVDINVHPTKAEVRFRFPGMVFSLFHQAVRESFGPAQRPAPGSALAEAHVAPPAVSIAEPLLIPAGPPAVSIAEPLFTPAERPPGKAFDLWQGERAGSATPALAQLAGEAAVAYGAAPPAVSIAEPPAVSIAEPPVVSTPPPNGRLGATGVPPVVLSVAGGTPAAPSSREVRPRPVPPGAPPAPAYPGRAAAGAAFRILGQAGGAYIVLEDDEGVKLLDQHAVHERVLFEDLQRRAREGARADSQGLLMPETVELTPGQAAAFSDPAAREALAELGFELADFGPRTVAVHAVPAVLKTPRAAGLVADLLEALGGPGDEAPGSPRAPSRAALREKAAYVLACKGAIKAGERLTIDQMQALVGEFHRRMGSSGGTCPHGRPVAVELTWDELERKVGRT